jgi:hypothetical protein
MKLDTARARSTFAWTALRRLLAVGLQHLRPRAEA